jgi:murein DD-endopeptidase MepM/ murein hydrolase activator NlpD
VGFEFRLKYGSFVSVALRTGSRARTRRHAHKIDDVNGWTKFAFVFGLLILVLGCVRQADADVPRITAMVLPTHVPTRTLTPSPVPTKPPPPTPLPTIQAPSQGFVLAPKGDNYTPTELALREHYWLEWPGPGRLLTTYPYGGRWPGGTWVHRGVDINARTGDPVLAVAPGVVIEAGSQLVNINGRKSDAYGIHVFMRLDQTFDGWPIYILYAHFSQVLVEAGQHVEGGELIGLAGATGFTTGPHIHLEVRIGENDPYHTRNPELWLKPRDGSGTLAGRLVDPTGKYIHERSISLYQGDRLVRLTRTYASSVVNPDEGWGENFVFWEVPPGRYTVRADLGTETHLGSAEVVAGRTVLVTFTTLGIPATITPSPEPTDAP